MDDNLKDFSLALRPKKSSDGSSRRQEIMQELLNELLVINDVIEKERTHPFSSLEVIIEEVTPCSSSQQLENNLSAIKAELRTHAQDQDLEQDSGSDSDEEFDTSGEFVQNKHSLKDMFHTNMLFIKQRAQLLNNADNNSDVSTTSTKNGSSFNDSNTSNIDGRTGDSCNVSDSTESPSNKRKCTKSKSDSVTSEDESEKTTNKKNNCDNANFETTEDKEDIYRKYDRFINDDDRYVKKEHPKNKFLTLNKNYDRCSRNLSRNRKYFSTTNLDKFSEKEKENKSPYAWSVRQPPKTEIIKPKTDSKYCGDISFACLNTYSVKTKSNNKQASTTMNYNRCTDKELEEQFKPRKTDYNRCTVEELEEQSKPSKIDYNSCTVEELEDRLKYFEDQVKNIKEAFSENVQGNESTSYKYEQENQVISAEDDAHNCRVWRSELNNSINLNRGDYKSIDKSSNSIDNMPVKMGHIESSPNDSVESFKENKSSENDYSDNSLDENDVNYSGTLIVVKQSSRDTWDSGRYTRSSRVKNSFDSYDDNGNSFEEDIPEGYPKIMYPSISKHVSTQVTDTDWKKICYAKKEMSESGFLRLNLPNSSDDDILDETMNESRRNRTKVLFKSETAIIDDSVSESSTNIDTTPAFTPITIEEDLTEGLHGCGCSCVNNFKRMFFK